MKIGDRSVDPNRFDSIAGLWSNISGHYIRWFHETLTGECKIEWSDGSLAKIEYFKDYDCAQKRYSQLITKLTA